MKYNVTAYKDVELNQTGWWVVGETFITSLIAECDFENPGSVKALCHTLKDNKIISTANIRNISFTDTSSDIIEVRLKKDLMPMCRLERRRF